jgi:hypothetical protein
MVSNDLIPDVEICVDCYQPDYTEDKVVNYSLCDPLKQFSPLGIGVYIYFYYLKFVLFTFLLTCVMVSIPTIILSIGYNQEIRKFCLNNSEKNACKEFANRTNDDDWLYSMNCDNVGYYTTQLYEPDGTAVDANIVDYGFIYFMAMIVLYITKFFFVIIVDASKLEIDMLSITPSDYALMVTNLPQDIKNKDILISEYLTITKNEIQEIKPCEINITYKISDYIKTKNDFLEIRKKIKQAELKARRDPTVRLVLNIDSLRKKQMELAKTLNNYLADLDNPEKKLFTGIAFVTFNTSAEYEAFLDEFPQSGITYVFLSIQYVLYKCLCFNCCDKKKIQKLHNKLFLGVTPAPEPSDVLWENLEVSFSQRTLRTLLCYFITILFLCASFGICFGLNKIQLGLHKKESATKLFLSLSISVTIFIINFIVEVIVNFLTDYERKISVSTKYLSNSIKLQMVIIS